MSDKLKFNAKTTKQIQTFIANRALRWIFAYNRSDYINKLRTRVVNAELYKAEAEQWENWNKNQNQAEKNRRKSDDP